jgi:hypothetical protein
LCIWNITAGTRLVVLSETAGSFVIASAPLCDSRAMIVAEEKAVTAFVEVDVRSQQCKIIRFSVRYPYCALSLDGAVFAGAVDNGVDVFRTSQAVPVMHYPCSEKVTAVAVSISKPGEYVIVVGTKSGRLEVFPFVRKEISDE